MQVRSEVLVDGYALRCVEAPKRGLFKKTGDAVAEWAEGIQKLNPFAAAVIDELAASEKLVSRDAHTVFLSFAHAATLNAADAGQLNLPAAFPYYCDIQSKGALGTEAFSISYYATSGGVRVVGTFSEGIFANENKMWRISRPLFEILVCINRLNRSSTAQEKIGHFAALRTLIPDDPDSHKLRPENFILRLRIAHVTAIGLNPSISEGMVNFDPVPMRRRDVDDHEAGAEPAITPDASDKFASEFRRQNSVNATYALNNGFYLFIDPTVRKALTVVKAKQKSSLEERMAFLMSPARFISEAYGHEEAPAENVSIGDTLFFETGEFSERVHGIGEWIPPQLTYIEGESNTWLPERFSIVIGGKLVTGEPDDVPDWIDKVKKAQASGDAEVKIGDVTLPTDTPGLLSTLQRIRPPENPPGADSKKEDLPEVPRRVKKVLQAKTNFDRDEFKRTLKERSLDNSSLPIINAVLKAHQSEGVKWLTNCYIAGWPGVLLADDMGLGKTLQSLTFLMMLYREGVIRKGRPALIVAPTSLLRNWQDEHAKHTLSPGLGEGLVAFGASLRDLKVGVAEADGIPLLDSAKIASKVWVLTTYETLRDYHMSFASVRFSVAILDEIQKAKNPATRLNAALNTLNADFVVSMTGTPVENSIADLWAIADITAPGLFAPLREFVKDFGKSQDPEERHKKLERLSRELLEQSEVDGRSIPPFALRRLKEDVATDLPPKHQGPMIRATMPPVQAQRYAEISAATQANRINILRALHDFRSISLHPADPESVMGGLMPGDEYISMSSRLSEAFKILQRIAERQEKAIIFINSRRMQSVLSRLIQQRWGCQKPEFIRGDTLAGNRQDIVNRFSALEGFAVLILSPRAAGVGLNIVAANHVLHLDRWWNPAVEDQCTDRAYRIGATKPVFVYSVGAVHPQLQESSYDVVLDNLLRSRREISRRVFTSSEISVSEFFDEIGGAKASAQNEQILLEIDRAGYLILEEFVRDKLLGEGFNANLTRHSGDGGADIVVRNEAGDIISLVQCKHTGNIDHLVDGGLANDARRVVQNWRAKKAKVVGVTNARRFAPAVEEEFSRIGGMLVARNELLTAKFV